MLKVLIVEDERIIRKGIIYMIDWQSVNCQIIGEASDGIEGLQRIEKHRPDIIITDIKIPFLDGIEMLKKAKAFHDFEAIIISGYSDFEYAQKAIEIGVNKYLLKPIDPQLLLETLAQISKSTKAKLGLNQYPLLNINYEPNVHYNEYTNNAITYIQKHYREPISLSNVSGAIEISTTHLTNKFKTDTGISIGEFINRYRIKRAIHYLETSHYLVYEVAQMCGFSDYKYFISIFKKYTGITPTQFTKTKRN